jgi:16S rRNA (guanine527-N7)-methyltransferase
MTPLAPDKIAQLLEPYFAAGSDSTIAESLELSEKERLVAQSAIYLDLLLRWNGRTNLTAIRDPQEIVARHFGECFFTARLLGKQLPEGASLLDFGSGAGFPGVPIQLFRPDLRVVLAESQGKKAAFLRETVRVLGLRSEVWDQRVEAMPPDRRFDAVAMRAVDRMEQAIQAAVSRVEAGGILAILAGGSESAAFRLPSTLASWDQESFDLPESQQRRLLLLTRPASDA